MNDTIETYRKVSESVKAGASVTAEDLEAANAYAKRARRAKLVLPIKAARNAKNIGKTCSDKDCDRPAIVKGMCMKAYIREYRKDDANRERANKASREYAARQKALKASKA